MPSIVSGAASGAEVDRADERQREVVDDDAVEHRHGDRADLAGELERRVQVEDVVERRRRA